MSAEKVTIKPHFVHPDPGLQEKEPGDYALFIGHLDPEKGVGTLPRAWQHLRGVPAKIGGGGYLIEEVQDFIKQRALDSIESVGRPSQEALTALIKGARFLVWPSEGYFKNFGLVVIEAFACGVSVIASRTGVMAEIAKDKQAGLHLLPGEPHDLATKVEWAWTHPTELARMGREARAEFETKYTAERSYEMLRDIYESVINRHSSRAFT